MLEPANRIEPFGRYLARAYVAKKGFTAGTVAEAQELANDCDYIVTRADGLNFHIIAIVDGETHPGKQFSLSPERLRQIGQDCAKYTGKLGRTRMPVQIDIIETSTQPTSPADKQRLQPIKRLGLRDKVVLASWHIDTFDRTLWSNRIGRRLFHGGFIKKLLTNPRLPEDALVPKAPAMIAASAPPILTYALLIFLLFVYSIEALLNPAEMADPAIKTLILLGASGRSWVFEQHEWYRLFSAPLLHGGLIHLALNSYALYIAGRMLESYIGRAWYGAIFVISGLVGGLFSLMLMPPNIVTVGASGAIMGLFAASFVVSYHFPHGPIRSQIQTNSMQVLIASLLPLLPAIGGMQVDYGAHLGGAIAGAILGLILYALWDRTELYPKLRSLALIICVAGVAGAAYAGYMTRDFVGKMDALNRLIPESEIPASDAKWVGAADKLIHDYPDDPRGYFWKALALYDRADYAKSESMVTEALLKLQPVQSAFQPILGDNMRGLLALAQVQQGHTEAAKQTAASICTPLRNAPIGKYLDQAHLCD